LLVDDHPLVVAGLKSLLKAECEVVGVVGDERSLEATSRCKPELIFTDISLPLMHQREIPQLVGEGRTAGEFAGILNLSLQTVAFHKHQIINNIIRNAKLLSGV
jgi:DNA-binding NarL/FixJ family response regulator